MSDFRFLIVLTTNSSNKRSLLGCYFDYQIRRILIQPETEKPVETNSRRLFKNKGSGWRPIDRWKRDVPKARCRLPELDSHLCRTHQLLLGEYDTAFPLFPTERVLQNESLISRYFCCQTDQCAMGADHQRTGPFGKRQTQFLGSVSDDGNAQDEPLATSFLVTNHLSFRVALDQILAEFQL